MAEEMLLEYNDWDLFMEVVNPKARVLSPPTTFHPPKLFNHNRELIQYNWTRIVRHGARGRAELV